MHIIGLTGGIACGKSTVADMLHACGAAIVDADAISRSLTAPGGKALPLIRETFGDDVFAQDGTLNRPALSQKVFGNAENLRKLNEITHPLIRQEMEDQIEQCRKQNVQVVVLDVPLLFEAGMQHMADETACVFCPEEVQISRMNTRNGYSREEALSRIRSQWPVSKKCDLSDVVIDTNRPLEELKQAVSSLYDQWISA